MQKIIFLFILALAITGSVLVHADETYRFQKGLIYKAQFDENTHLVTLTGQMSTICAASPVPALEVDPSGRGLLLKVQSVQTRDFCGQALGAEFEIVFDIRTLKSNLASLSLDPNGTYSVHTENNELSTVIDFSGDRLNILPEDLKNLDAQVELTNGAAKIEFLVSDNGYEVSNPFISLERFVGKHVQLQGFVISHKLAVLDIGSTPSLPIFVVTGINTVPF